MKLKWAQISLALGLASLAFFADPLQVAHTKLAPITDTLDAHSPSPTPTPRPTHSPLPADLTVPTAQPAEARRRTVVLDPGHGGQEVGAVHHDVEGKADVVEKDVNLKIALRLRSLLQEEGYEVVMTREADRRVLALSETNLPAGYMLTRADLQARVDLANASKADVFISIHNNGSQDPNLSGTEVWYSKERPFSKKNMALARAVNDSLIAQIRMAGHRVEDRGIKDDSNFRVFRGRVYNIFVLGPEKAETNHPRATQMPGVLGESLFVSNHEEAELLKREAMLDAIAGGYRNGIVNYFVLLDSGAIGE